LNVVRLGLINEFYHQANGYISHSIYFARGNVECIYSTLKMKMVVERAHANRNENAGVDICFTFEAPRRWSMRCFLFIFVELQILLKIGSHLLNMGYIPGPKPCLQVWLTQFTGCIEELW